MCDLQSYLCGADLQIESKNGFGSIQRLREGLSHVDQSGVLRKQKFYDARRQIFVPFIAGSLAPFERRHHPSACAPSSLYAAQPTQLPTRVNALLQYNSDADAANAEIRKIEADLTSAKQRVRLPPV